VVSRAWRTKTTKKESGAVKIWVFGQTGGLAGLIPPKITPSVKPNNYRESALWLTSKRRGIATVANGNACFQGKPAMFRTFSIF
jgi:hypothetical protein